MVLKMITEEEKIPLLSYIQWLRMVSTPVLRAESSGNGFHQRCVRCKTRGQIPAIRGRTVLLCISIPMCATSTLYTKRKLPQYFSHWEGLSPILLPSSLPLLFPLLFSLSPSQNYKLEKSSLSSSSYHTCGVPLREQAPLQLFSLAPGLSLKLR